MDESTRKALVEKVENVIDDYTARELSDTDLEGLNGEELDCILECLQYGQVAKLREKQVNNLIRYLFNNMHLCPFEDEAYVNIKRECVGFAELGCAECILENIEMLN